MGLLDWFTESLASDPSAGFNRLGVLGAALQDIGAAQQGGQGNALASFAQQQRRHAAQDPQPDATHKGEDGQDWFTRPLNPSAGLNRLGVLGAAFQDFGAAQQGGQGNALANFLQQQRRYAVPYPSMAGSYANRSAMRNGPYRVAPRAGLQTVPNVSSHPGYQLPFEI